MDVDDFSTIRIVLFPRKIKITGVFNNQVSGRVTDVYGNLLSGVNILGASTGQQTDSVAVGSGVRKDNFVLTGIPNSETLTFSLAHHQAINNVGFANFSIVDVILFPEQKTVFESTPLPADRIVSGTISGTDGSASVPDATVFAESATALVKTKSRATGSYTIHLPGATNQLNFLTHQNLGPVEKSPVNNGIISVELFPHLHLKKQIPFNGNISGRVTNVQGGGIGGALVEVVGDSTKNTNTDNTGKFSIAGLTENTELKISKTDFQTLTFKVGRCAELEVKLYPALNKRVSQYGTAISSSLSGKVTRLDGVTGIAGVQIFEGSTLKATTVSDGTYSIGGLSGSLTLKFAKPGLKETSVSITKESADILLEPDDDIQTGAAAANTIQIVVTDPDGNPIPNSKFLAEDNTILDIALKNGNSNYALNVPPGSTWDVTAYDLGYVSTKISVNEGDKVFISLSKQIARKNPVTVVRGKITDVNGSTISGAKILSDAGVLLGESNSNGRFEITAPPAAPFNALVKHGAYEELTINIDDNSELEITLVPKKVYHVLTGNITDVKFIPIGGAVYGIEGTGIQKTTASDGYYDLPVPADLTDPLLFFDYAGYEKVNLDFDDHPPTFSNADIRLYFVNLNYFKLIQGGNILKDFSVNINALNLERDVRTQQFDKYSPTLKRGFILLTLIDDDFRHAEFPKVLTWHALDAANAIDIKGIPETDPPVLPNPPYTPAANGISVDYVSEQIITGVENEDIDQYYHLLSFNGHKWLPLEAVKPETEPKVQLIYPYMPDDTLPVTQNGAIRPYAPGNLFIGISDLTPGGTLSLLFQIADGTEPQPEALAPAIHWSYLAAGNTWLPFKTGDIIRDNTSGLTRSGIIQFAVPTLAVKENTMLNPEYFWLRAAARQADTANGEAPTKVQALPSMTNIRAQVVQARFKNEDNDLSHLAQPLPAETISKLVESRTAVKKVEQPLESFGGKLPESAGLDFYYRVSERLRHKDRAVTVWDYEHLLLEQYPEAAAAKCIQHTRYKPASKASELAPGYVTVAVIPDLKKRKGEPWPEPRFTQGDLDDMRLYLAARANLFVAYGEKEEAHLQVVNPLYEKVDLLVTVAFMPGIDEAFYKEQLQQELTYYISPWLADPLKPPAFGRTLQRSAILQFIEERPYIDYVDLADPLTNESKFLIRMQTTDIAGRPVTYLGVATTKIGDKDVVVEVTKAKSRILSEKICPSSARAILVAGTIIVGSTKDADPVTLPPSPANMIRLCPQPTGSGGKADPGSKSRPVASTPASAQTSVAKPGTSAGNAPKTAKTKK